MVGQFENVLMPSRICGSESTSTLLNVTFRPERICTTAAENPHCGAAGTPFMNSTTSLLAMTSLIRSAVEFVICYPSMLDCVRPSLRRRGFESQRGEGTAHLPLQRVVDHLVLLDPALADEGRGGHARTVMIAVTSKVDNNDVRIRKSLLDEALDLRSCHRHRVHSRCNHRDYAKSKPSSDQPRKSANTGDYAHLSNGLTMPDTLVRLSAGVVTLFDVRFPTPWACGVSDLT